MDMDELAQWFAFIGKLILECLCLAAWIVLAWWLHVYLAKLYPLEGIPKIMLYILEFTFYCSTLFHLFKLLFGPRKKTRTLRWWE